MRKFIRRMKFVVNSINNKGLKDGIYFLYKWQRANKFNLPHEVNIETTAVCNLK